jgi:hypothetical protein
VRGAAKNIIITLVGLAAVIPASQFVGRYMAEAANDRDSAQSTDDRFANVGSGTKVLVSRQDAEGVTEDQLTSEVANKLGAYSLERVKVHTAKILAGMKSTESVESITADSVLLNVDSRNIVVTRFHVGLKVPYIQFLGIGGNEMTRVLCMAAPTEDVIIAGNCADKLKEQFGVSMEASGLRTNG